MARPVETQLSMALTIGAIPKTSACLRNCEYMKDVKDLSAFAAIAKHLPVPLTILKSIDSRVVAKGPSLSPMDPAVKGPDKEKAKYAQAKRIVDKLTDKATRLEIISEKVALYEDDGNGMSRKDHYTGVVEEHGGEPIEALVKGMLLCVLDMGNKPLDFLEEAEVAKLQQVLKDVAKLPSSLGKRKEQSGYVFHNHGDGVQATYLGRQGNQNIGGKGAPMVTGNVAQGVNIYPGSQGLEESDNK